MVGPERVVLSIPPARRWTQRLRAGVACGGDGPSADVAKVKTQFPGPRGVTVVRCAIQLAKSAPIRDGARHSMSQRTLTHEGRLRRKQAQMILFPGTTHDEFGGLIGSGDAGAGGKALSWLMGRRDGQAGGVFAIGDGQRRPISGWAPREGITPLAADGSVRTVVRVFAGRIRCGTSWTATASAPGHAPPCRWAECTAFALTAAPADTSPISTSRGATLPRRAPRQYR